MTRCSTFAALLALAAACSESNPADEVQLGAAGAGGAADIPGASGSTSAATDAGPVSDAAAAEVPDGMLFGSGVFSDAAVDVQVSDDPCFLALAWEDGYSFWADEEPLGPADTVTLDGVLYRYVGAEAQVHMLADCAPDAPVSWCAEQGWMWETVGSC